MKPTEITDDEMINRNLHIDAYLRFIEEYQEKPVDFYTRERTRPGNLALAVLNGGFEGVEKRIITARVGSNIETSVKNPENPAVILESFPMNFDETKQVYKSIQELGYENIWLLVGNSNGHQPLYTYSFLSPVTTYFFEQEAELSVRARKGTLLMNDSHEIGYMIFLPSLVDIKLPIED